MDQRRKLQWWQAQTIALMFIGYSGYYLCRSNFSVCLPLIINDLASRGVNAEAARIHLGTIASAGVLAYALGKFLLGGAADFLGGRRNFLGGMAGAVLCTAIFALGGSIPVFTLAWIGNRFVQSGGWAGMVKVTSKWFSYSSYGAVMGIISLSYLFGDAVARNYMGILISRGLTWRGVFYVAAGTLLGIFLLNLLLLKESRTEIGAPPPDVNPLNLFGEAQSDAAPTGVGVLMRTLFSQPSFWVVCSLSLGCTLVRETFNTWVPTYFTAAVGFSGAKAAQWSALFPLFGGFSVLLAGVLSDRLGRGGRAWVMFAGLVFSSLGLFSLGSVTSASSRALPVVLVALVGFLILGPYSYLAGAIALDFGGRQGSATASGVIDGVGYLGGILSGDTVARISVRYGWRGAFLMLAAVAVASSIAAALFLIQQRRPRVLPQESAG